MKRWRDLGVVDTIYEEEDDHEDNNSSYSSSHSPSDLSADDHLTVSPPSPLQDIVKTWSLATGLQTEVVIHVQDQCFHLHKDPLVSKSSYLKRHLMNSSEITISPPLKITAETFSSVVDFCYSCQIVITPFNVAALRIAAELLEMSSGDSNGRDDDNSLRWKTESYFCEAVSVNREFAAVVLRSCLTLLPEAVETVSLTSSCIEALGLMDEVDGWGEEIMSLTKDQLQMIADSMHEKLEYNHDLLYTILDYYIKGHAGKITEEEKTMLCSSVDCNKLSPNLIMHAVQNPRMPLKFIVRAMLVEQLNTRRSIVRAAAIATTTITSNNHPHDHNNNTNINEDKEPITLGAILQRDATLRNVAQIKATMEATSSKIERLEKDLMGMKKLLNKNDQKKASSFRFSSDKVVSKGDRKWAASFRFSDTKRDGGDYSPCASERSTTIASTEERSFKWRFLNGLKTAFGMSRKHDSSRSFNLKEVDDGDEDEDGFGLEEEHHYHHRRSRSFV